MPRQELSTAVINRLVDALISVPGADERATRTAMLNGIPNNIRHSIGRTDIPFVDFTNIIDQLDKLGRLDNGERPVVILAHNAWRMTSGSETGRELAAIEKEIEKSYDEEPPLADLPDTPEVLIFGGPGEWVPATFLEQASSMGPSVARLLVPKIVKGQLQKMVGMVGTGWLIAPRLLLTNHHVIAARDQNYEALPSDADFQSQGEKAVAWFDYHVEGGDHIDVPAIRVVASSEKLDYALLELDDAKALSKRNALSINRDESELPRGVRLNIVQCPSGGPLRYAIRNNFYVGRGKEKFQLRYLTDTEKGSSGSPVLDDRWQVVALHRGAKEVPPDVFKGEAGQKNVAKFHNEGIDIHHILSDLDEPLRQRILKAQGWA